MLKNVILRQNKIFKKCIRGLNLPFTIQINQEVCFEDQNTNKAGVMYDSKMDMC